MNRVEIMGRLTRDPEVRYSKGESSIAIAKYTLAIERRRRRTKGSGQNADFIPVVALDRSAEFAEKYFRQGMRVIVTGEIETSSYVNKAGKTIYTWNVIADDQEFADGKSATGYQPEQEGNWRPSYPNEDKFADASEYLEDEGLPYN